MIKIRRKVDKSNSVGIVVIFLSLFIEELPKIKHFLSFPTV